MKNKKHLLKSSLIIITLLLILRLLLPYFLLDRINNKLANINGYEGKIEDLELALYKGTIIFEEATIDKFEADQLEPFVSLPTTEVSIQWKSLWKGSIVGKSKITKPEIHLKMNQNGDLEQDGSEVDWISVVKELSPLTINKFTVVNGKFNVKFPESETPVLDYDLDSINIIVENISNVEDLSKALPTRIDIQANSRNYKGKIKLDGNANLIAEKPDIDFNLTINGLSLKSLNPFLKFYTGMDFESGSLNLYSEIALSKNQITGYIKPSLLDPSFFKWKEKDRSFLNSIKEIVAEGTQELFENQKKEQTASKIKFNGSLESVDVNYWGAFSETVVNAYIEALKNQLDHTISFENLKT